MNHRLSREGPLVVDGLTIGREGQMRTLRWIPLVLMVAASFLAGAVTPPDHLPAVFSGLVPPGYTLVSPGFKRSVAGDEEMKITNLGVTFVASKPFKGHHASFDGELGFDLVAMEYPEMMVRSRGKLYQIQFDQDVESARAAYAEHRSDPITGYDTTKETKYSWGWGITQRRLHHWVGAGTAPDDIDYTGEYYGLIVGDTTIKKFHLTVCGVKTSEEANQWAVLCADKIAETPVAAIQ
jgi:hypothetical protein